MLRVPTVCRADVGERKTYIESIHTNIKTLEEEIRVKQNTVQHNKTNAKRYDSVKMTCAKTLMIKVLHILIIYITVCLLYTFSMKATKSLLLQYEQSLKAELEVRRAHYNHDMWVQLALGFS